jgi:hypothetical protein
MKIAESCCFVRGVIRRRSSPRRTCSSRRMHEALSLGVPPLPLATVLLNFQAALELIQEYYLRIAFMKKSLRARINSTSSVQLIANDTVTLIVLEVADFLVDTDEDYREVLYWVGCIESTARGGVGRRGPE